MILIKDTAEAKTYFQMVMFMKAHMPMVKEMGMDATFGKLLERDILGIILIIFALETENLFTQTDPNILVSLLLENATELEHIRLQMVMYIKERGKTISSTEKERTLLKLVLAR